MKGRRRTGEGMLNEPSLLTELVERKIRADLAIKKAEEYLTAMRVMRTTLDAPAYLVAYAQTEAGTDPKDHRVVESEVVCVAGENTSVTWKEVRVEWSDVLRVTAPATTEFAEEPHEVSILVTSDEKRILHDGPRIVGNYYAVQLFVGSDARERALKSQPFRR